MPRSGISQASIVHDAQQLRDRVDYDAPLERIMQLGSASQAAWRPG